ncbi:MAG: HAD family hydrolase [Clostridiales bacterium]|nr:HAD family hydrolase [Clostridiales bacterium]
MYKAVVFDLDGTLLDTLDDLTDAVNYALNEYGLPLRTRAEVCSFVGNGIARLIALAVGDCDVDKEGVLSVFRAYYKIHCKDKTKPYEDILPLLKELKNRGIQTAVLSNKADFAVQPLVEEYFHGWIDMAQGENEAEGIMRKPNPNGLLQILKTLGCLKSEAVYVGDSDVDIKTAQNAQIDCISVTWGFRDEEFLRDFGAEKVVRSPLQILEEI